MAGVGNALCVSGPCLSSLWDLGQVIWSPTSSISSWTFCPLSWVAQRPLETPGSSSGSWDCVSLGSLDIIEGESRVNLRHAEFFSVKNGAFLYLSTKKKTSSPLSYFGPWELWHPSSATWSLGRWYHGCGLGSWSSLVGVFSQHRKHWCYLGPWCGMNRRSSAAPWSSPPFPAPHCVCPPALPSPSTRRLQENSSVAPTWDCIQLYFYQKLSSPTAGIPKGPHFPSRSSLPTRQIQSKR